MFQTFNRATSVALAGLVILTTFGCQSTPSPQPTERSTPRVDERANHEALLDRARALDSAEAAPLYLEAARELLAVGDLARAASALEAIDRALLPPAQRFEFDLTRAALAIDDGRAGEAFAILSGVRAADRAQEGARLAALARAAAAASRHGDAAIALIAYAEQTEQTDQQGLSDRIWSHIMRTPPDLIAARAAGRVPVGSATEQGWWRLAAMLQAAFDVAEQREALARWWTSEPRHPAATMPPTALRRLRNPTSHVDRVAMLLPLSGSLASAGRAVRDGFVAAFYHSSADRRIAVYDTADTDVAAAYEEAAADGADVLVGPLDKAKVSQLNALGTRAVPVLALNQLPETEHASPGLLQFALAVEDEGRALAQRVAEDGRERIVLMRADQEWAQRASSAFTASVTDAQQLVASGVIYDVRSLTDEIARALLVDRSLGRANEIGDITGTRPEFVPRRRQDVDAVVALVDAVQARALHPALAFYFAGDVPVYMSSQSVQGLDAGGLNDLDGARVCLLPWRLRPDPVRGKIEQTLPGGDGVLAPLYALGTDAYRIVDRLDAFAGSSDERILGATGVLRLDPLGRVQRELAWAIVRNGRLEPLPIATDPAGAD